MDDKVYTPEVVDQQPFPTEGTGLPTSLGSPSAGSGTDTPKVIDSQVFPVRKVAVDLISSVLNTRSRKILQSFDLEQAGGFQIGNFEEGVTGDLRITPEGLVARDLNGVITFAIGSDGNATFQGTVQAGTIISGEVVVGDNRLVLDVDENGHGTIVVFDTDGLARVVIGYGDF